MESNKSVTYKIMEFAEKVVDIEFQSMKCIISSEQADKEIIKLYNELTKTVGTKVVEHTTKQGKIDGKSEMLC